MYLSLLIANNLEYLTQFLWFLLLHSQKLNYLKKIS